MAFLTAVPFSQPRRTRLLGLASAVLVAAAFWIGTESVFGVRPCEPEGRYRGCLPTRRGLADS